VRLNQTVINSRLVRSLDEHHNGGVMWLRRLQANTAGSITITFALAFLAFTVSAGCAIDYLRWTKVKTELQALTDAAALSAAASTATT
jgi:Flp pilus assembly protein TadG